MPDKLTQILNDLPANTELVFEPVPDTAQSLALDTRADITLLEGSRGGMKTATQLMFFRRYVGLGYGSKWKGVIIDREYKDLQDMVAQSKRFFHSFEDGAKFLSSASEYKWVWPTGEELLFRHAKKPDDYDQFHGNEFTFLGWNELTKQVDSTLFDKVMSTNRSSFVPERDTQRLPNGDYVTPNNKPLPPIPLRVMATTNSSGIGRMWVKRRFIDVAPRGQITERRCTVFDPRTKQDVEVVKTQVTLHFSWRENPHLDVAYIAELHNISDPALRASWFKGSWDVTIGGLFDDLWSLNVHVRPRFNIPKSWFVDRCYDWGSSSPFYVAWVAEADGTNAIMPDGSIWCPVRGSLIFFHEWYGVKIGTDGRPMLDSNQGLRMSSPDQARAMKQMEDQMLEVGLIQVRPSPGPADNQIENVNDVENDSISVLMAKEGITWLPSNKSSGSLVTGAQLFRDRLSAAIKHEGPAVYCCVGCHAFIELIAPLRRDDIKIEQHDDAQIDHPWDAVRYRVLKGNNRLAVSFGVSWPK